MSELAKLADSTVRPAVEGYVAERHPAMPGLILVWGPCGCYWVLSDRHKESFITPCGKPECSFNWADAGEALAKLGLAEKQGRVTQLTVTSSPAPAPTEETSS